MDRETGEHPATLALCQSLTCLSADNCITFTDRDRGRKEGERTIEGTHAKADRQTDTSTHTVASERKGGNECGARGRTS